jgi:hypothetical protein
MHDVHDAARAHSMGSIGGEREGTLRIGEARQHQVIEARQSFASAILRLRKIAGGCIQHSGEHHRYRNAKLLRHYNRPVTTSTSNTIRTKPKPPLG